LRGSAENNGRNSTKLRCAKFVGLWRLLRGGRGGPSSSVNFIKKLFLNIKKVIILRYNYTKYLHITK
jgi:hypothetical protein